LTVIAYNRSLAEAAASWVPLVNLTSNSKTSLVCCDYHGFVYQGTNCILFPARCRQW